MKLTQGTAVKKPIPCYIVFNGMSNNNPYEAEDIYRADSIYMDGDVEIFKSINEFNNYLSNVDIESIILDSMYKGYLFPAKHFPLKTIFKNSTVFILETASDISCFVERVESLNLAAESIQDEVELVADIENYMVFDGNPVNLSFRYDEEEDICY
ncbi:MAG: hypothetical protein GWP10_13435 [Nitrospiraceae bacterium]|nr:hypothetical protein [Nitrospiraceae bacterium]